MHRLCAEQGWPRQEAQLEGRERDRCECGSTAPPRWGQGCQRNSRFLKTSLQERHVFAVENCIEKPKNKNDLLIISHREITTMNFWYSFPQTFSLSLTHTCTHAHLCLWHLSTLGTPFGNFPFHLKIRTEHFPKLMNAILF